MRNRTACKIMRNRTTTQRKGWLQTRRANRAANKAAKIEGRGKKEELRRRQKTKEGNQKTKARKVF